MLIIIAISNRDKYDMRASLGETMGKHFIIVSNEFPSPSRITSRASSRSPRRRWRNTGVRDHRPGVRFRSSSGPLRGGRPASRAAWYTGRMNEKSISALREIYGERLRTSLEDRITYSYDATRKEFLPDVVVFPVVADEVRRTVLLANDHRFPVVPRGAG